MQKLEWDVLSKSICFETKWFRVARNKAELCNGTLIDDYYSIENQDAVMILAIDPDGNVILKQEYRLPVKKLLIELPAGAIEKKDKSILDAAKRELKEETGYSSENWEYIGPTYDCPERCTAMLHLFIAHFALQNSEQKLDKNEIIKIIKVSFDEAMEMCMDGRIEVNSCIHAILKAARKLSI